MKCLKTIQIKLNTFENNYDITIINKSENSEDNVFSFLTT